MGLALHILPWVCISLRASPLTLQLLSREVLSMGTALKTGPEGRPRPALLKVPCLAPEPVPLVWSTPRLAPRQPCFGRQAGRAGGWPRAAKRAPQLPLFLHRPLPPALLCLARGDVFHSSAHKFHPAVPSSFLELNFSEDATSPRPCACAEEKREGARGGQFGWVG